MSTFEPIPTAAFIAFAPLRIQGDLLFKPKVLEERDCRVYVYPATTMRDGVLEYLQNCDAGSIAFASLSRVVVLVDVATTSIMKCLNEAGILGEKTLYVCHDEDVIDIMEEMTRSHPGASVVEVSTNRSHTTAFVEMIEKFCCAGTL
jgi:hypothetical protein